MGNEIRQTEFDSRKAVVIAETHPHYDAVAICMGAQYTNVGWGMIFKRVDTEEEFFVFNGREVKWIDRNPTRHGR